jgi:zinc and cadmium transporter
VDNPALRLALFSVVLVAASVAGSAIPLLTTFSRRRLQFALAVAAGLLRGAAFFHLSPAAVPGGATTVLYVTPIGFITLFLLERYLMVHVCAPEEEGCEVHSFGLTAFIGIAFHSLTEGVAAGSALASPSLALTVFSAVLLHKIPESFALALILRGAGHSPRRVLALVGALAAAFPLGAAVFLIVPSLSSDPEIRTVALAFSAGTFLHISFSDLLPTAHRHSESRIGTSVATVAGLAVMYALTAFV